MLSRLLFIWFVNRLKEGVSPGVGISMYADDVVVCYRDRARQAASSRFQGAVSSITRWSQVNRLRLNPAKCHVAFF